MQSMELSAGEAPPQVTLSKDTLKAVKAGGPQAVEAVQADLAKQNTKQKLAAMARVAGAKLQEMNANVKRTVGELPQQAVAVLVGGGAGAYVGFVSYNYLRGYFGAASFAPDIIVPLVGIGIGYAGAQLKDKADAPGARAPIRAGLIGVGGGMTLMSLARSYQTYVMA